MMTRLRGIYGILPAGLETEALLLQAERALAGGVRILQLRDKKRGYRRALKRAGALRELTRSCGALLIVNDSVQLAMDCEADGVHLGRDDAVPGAAQLSRIRKKMLVGITCRADTAFAGSVLAAGADYISFGAIWRSDSKPEVPAIGLPGLARARLMFPEANICAIGGITAANVATVRTAGADCAAVISGLFAGADTETEARRLIEAWG